MPNFWPFGQPKAMPNFWSSGQLSPRSPSVHTPPSKNSTSSYRTLEAALRLAVPPHPSQPRTGGSFAKETHYESLGFDLIGCSGAYYYGMFWICFRGKHLGSGSADGHIAARKPDRYGGAGRGPLCYCPCHRPPGRPSAEKISRTQSFVPPQQHPTIHPPIPTH